MRGFVIFVVGFMVAHVGHCLGRADVRFAVPLCASGPSFFTGMLVGLPLGALVIAVAWSKR